MSCLTQGSVQSNYSVNAHGMKDGVNEYTIREHLEMSMELREAGKLPNTISHHGHSFSECSCTSRCASIVLMLTGAVFCFFLIFFILET